MRTIKFRGKDAATGGWVYGSLLIWPDGSCKIFDKQLSDGSMAGLEVEPSTVGQFTGLLDKNGKEIYEGDIVEYYELCTYCINPDCEPHLIGYGDSLCKKTFEVEFTDGSFELNYCGLHKEDLDELKEREERDAYFETNGYEINDSIIGIKVIGNIHDNPQLINK